jgi:alpha-L-arabinofuranosidase
VASAVQVVNFGSDTVNLTVSTSGLGASVNALGSTATVLTSGNVMDENSFSNPNKVCVPMVHACTKLVGF